jgi:short-subunit dehydrogenase
MIALITGASSGIGEELARLAAHDGHDLVLVARSADKLNALANSLAREHGIRATALPEDLADPQAVDAIVDVLAARGIEIDILMNNAGFATYGAFAQTGVAEERDEIAVNITAPTLLMKRLLPRMLARRSGRILNVASTAAFQPGPLMAVYYASKAYLLLLSEAVANEVEGTGVTVTCLCPGPTRTGFQARAGVERMRLMKWSRVMDAATVARAGYEAMMAGRPLVVTGLLNKVVAQSIRISPRRVVTRVVRAINESR